MDRNCGRQKVTKLKKYLPIGQNGFLRLPETGTPSSGGSVEGAKQGKLGNRQRWGEELFRPLSRGPPKAPAPPPGRPGQWPSSASVPGREQALGFHTTRGLERRPASAPPA